jgi:hypothetical protein
VYSGSHRIPLSDEWVRNKITRAYRVKWKKEQQQTIYYSLSRSEKMRSLMFVLPTRNTLEATTGLLSVNNRTIPTPYSLVIRTPDSVLDYKRRRHSDGWLASWQSAGEWRVVSVEGQGIMVSWIMNVPAYCVVCRLLETGVVLEYWRYVIGRTPPKGGRVVESTAAFWQCLRRNCNCVGTYHSPTLRCLEVGSRVGQSVVQTVT